MSVTSKIYKLYITSHKNLHQRCDVGRPTDWRPRWHRSSPEKSLTDWLIDTAHGVVACSSMIKRKRQRISMVEAVILWGPESW